MKTRQELEQLAIDVITNRVFLANTAEAIQAAFGVILTVMKPEDVKVLAAKKPTALYEYYDKAGERSINGYPSFLSMNIITQDEWEIFLPILQAKENALKGGV